MPANLEMDDASFTLAMTNIHLELQDIKKVYMTWLGELSEDHHAVLGEDINVIVALGETAQVYIETMLGRSCSTRAYAAIVASARDGAEEIKKRVKGLRRLRKRMAPILAPTTRDRLR